MTETESKPVAIKVEHLHKSFKMGNAVFDALHDVSFTLYKGEVMGVIGSNGSGKSTLLKILGAVLKPTSGQAQIYGDVTSILSVGDNFHPDLSGRENANIHLRLHDLPKKGFDGYHERIRAFSEIGDFYEQPVKTYSAGMFLRLAFSVALQLSADILLLDEVLAVGDEGFQLKCKEELLRIAAEGKTIIFVTHNRLEVQDLATRCLWLHKGKIHKIGSPSNILGEYLLMHKDNHDGNKKIVDVNPFLVGKDSGIHIEWPEEHAPGNETMSIRRISVSSIDGTDGLYNTSPVLFKFVIYKKKKGIRIGPFFFLQDAFYQPVMVGHFLNNKEGNVLDVKTKDEIGLIEISCILPAHFLLPGNYFLGLRFGMEENEWNTLSAEGFRFSENLRFTLLAGEGFQDFVGDPGKGSVRPLLEWNMSKM